MFPQRLRAARKAKGLTQEELAKKIHTKKATISNYENGYSSPNNETLSLLADVLMTSVDYLLGRTDDPSPADKSSDDLTKQYPILADIDPELLQRFAEVIKEDPYQSLFFDDILSASKEEREQIVREWLELRKKYRSKPKDGPDDEGPSAWDIVKGNKT